eukprot:1626084-Rhodomonas_salina.1
MSLSAFQTIEDSFRQKIADDAGVPVDDVKLNIEEKVRRRRLLSAGIEIQIEIIVSDSAAATSLNNNLEGFVGNAGLPDFQIVNEPTTVQINRCPSNE